MAHSLLSPAPVNPVVIRLGQVHRRAMLTAMAHNPLNPALANPAATLNLPAPPLVTPTDMVRSRQHLSPAVAPVDQIIPAVLEAQVTLEVVPATREVPVDRTILAARMDRVTPEVVPVIQEAPVSRVTLEVTLVVPGDRVTPGAVVVPAVPGVDTNK